MTKKVPKQEKRVEEPEVWRVFQRRGSIQILILLSDGQAMRASEFDKALPFIARQVIGNRLNEMRELGILNREVHAGPPILSRYSLTEKGLRIANAALILNGYGRADHLVPANVPKSPEIRSAVVMLTALENSAVLSEKERSSVSNLRDDLERLERELPEEAWPAG